MTSEPKSKRGGRRNPQPGGPRKLEERPHFDTALEYAMHVINDTNVTGRRRDTMAYWVLRTGHQLPIGKPTIDQPSGKKALANIEAQSAHEATDWGRLVQ
jgi:hypothetical protein